MSDTNDGVGLEVEDQIEDSPALETDQQDVEYSDDGYETDSNDDGQELDDVDVVEDEDKVQLRLKVEEQQRIIDLFQQTIQRPAQEKEYVPQEPEYDPDDLATYDSVQKLIQKEVGTVKQSQKDYVIQQQKAQMIANNPDYQQMYEAGISVVQASNDPAAMELAIMSSANPPELIYNLGLSKSASQKPRQSNVAGRVKKNLSKPNTLSQAGGQRHDTKKDWNSLSKEEIEQEIRKRTLGL